MSIATIVLGESGTGKTASLRTLSAADTLLIQPVKKPLPFKSKDWAYFDAEKRTGNIFATDDAATIVKLMTKTSRKIIVVDDWQYVLANEFMRRNDEKGYEKFNDIGRHAWDILMAAGSLAHDVRVYVFAHTNSDEFGRVRIKTIGKMLDDKITPEGLVTICLRTSVVDGQYLFSTKNNGSDTVKSPMGLFDDPMIPNDLAAIDAAICDYYNLSQPD